MKYAWKPRELERLIRRAEKSPLRRARVCLHESTSSPVQEMLIALCRDTYLPPLRQYRREKSFTVLRGKMALIFFSNDGQLRRRVVLGPAGSGGRFLCRVDNKAWHMTLPLSRHVVFHEVIRGPMKQTARAPWAPQRAESPEAKLFIRRMRQGVRRMARNA